jgi:hypothetical protein
MQKGMIGLLACCFAASALAEQPQATRADSAGPIPDGWQFETGGATAFDVGFLGSNLGAGYDFGQHEVRMTLIASFSSSTGTVLANGTGSAGSSTETFVGLSPGYRYYVTPLVTGGVAPFVQAALALSAGVPTNNGQEGGVAYGVGGSVSGGFEYLITRHFGAGFSIDLLYMHQFENEPSTSLPPNPTTDTANVSGTLSLYLHL